jgi:alginate O-acetyltransferase complex protein AlgI
MTFNSLTFIAFFILFYSIFLSLNSWTKKKILIVISGYIFYGWWNPIHLSLLISSTIFNFLIAKKISQCSFQPTRKKLLLLCISLNLLLICIFKYFNFFSYNFSLIFDTFGMKLDYFTINVLLPIGISFYTFEAISYVADVYTKKLSPAKTYLDFSLFMSFFPRLVAGPIVRASDFLPQTYQQRNITVEHINTGIKWIVLGFFFKIGVADNLSSSVDYVFTGSNSALPIEAWLGTIYFSIQIFGDFFGYTLIARGLAKLIGFDLIENFRYPYIATGLQDFWKRWHISLSTWLRDYLYISLGGSKHGKLLTYRNLLITMFLGGLWHGAAWTFIIWGVLHGLYLIVERILSGFIANNNRLRFLLSNNNVFVHISKILFTYILILISWTYFRAVDIEQAHALLSQMLNISSLYQEFNMPNKSLLKDGVWLFPAIVYFAWAFYKERYKNTYKFSMSTQMAALSLLAFITITCREASDAFIYFQF